jgi:hypothetical protein
MIRSVAAGVLGAGAVAVAAAQAKPDPLVATWVVNVAKSSYDPGPAPKSLSILVVPDPEGYKLTQDAVSADGKASHDVFIFKPDGKEYPVASTPGATVSLTRVDARTYERVTRMNGKVTMTSRTVVSADGKTRTTTTAGTDAKGKPVRELVFYDRK